ncbi:MAG: NADH-quinone oxidoreductase subunit C [Actinomycetota bacterium]|nr:NADH-quinone oxidoreductase subunit C [Actinomycetota bacterium]
MAGQSAITPGEALARVEEALGPWVEEPRLNFGGVDLICRPGNLVRAMRTLRDSERLDCVFFTFLSGVDRSELGEGGGGLEVLIHVYSPEHVFHVTVHVPVDPAAPECPSISGIYKGALWHERETHEMFGILFPGHPNLTVLYLPEDFEGHPLLRSFKLPTRVVKAWPGAKDPEEAAAGGR